MKNTICFKTKYGWINATEFNKSIISISFGKTINKGSSIQLKAFQRLMKEYFKSKKIVWKLKLKFTGSDLQKKIWKELQKIPYGQIRTYKYIANKCKTSPRYVGNVCGQNRHIIVVPCHRVVRSDGKLGGFSSYGGIKLKQNLLDLEN